MSRFTARAQVETLADEHVRVMGIPDACWGEKMAAVLRPGREPSLEDLSAHCPKQIAGYKVPRALHVVERIPRHPSGKPDCPWAERTAREALG